MSSDPTRPIKVQVTPCYNQNNLYLYCFSTTTLSLFPALYMAISLHLPLSLSFLLNSVCSPHIDQCITDNEPSGLRPNCPHWSQWRSQEFFSGVARMGPEIMVGWPRDCWRGGGVLVLVAIVDGGGGCWSRLLTGGGGVLCAIFDGGAFCQGWPMGWPRLSGWWPRPPLATPWLRHWLKYML